MENRTLASARTCMAAARLGAHLPLKAPVAHVQHAVRVALEVGVVRDHQARDALLEVDAQQQIHDLHRVLAVRVCARARSKYKNTHHVRA